MENNVEIKIYWKDSHTIKAVTDGGENVGHLMFCGGRQNSTHKSNDDKNKNRPTYDKKELSGISINVEEDFQRYGIATKLYKFLFSRMPECNIRASVHMSNRPSRKLHKKLGFKRLSWETVFKRADPEEAYYSMDHVPKDIEIHTIQMKEINTEKSK